MKRLFTATLAVSLLSACATDEEDNVKEDAQATEEISIEEDATIESVPVDDESEPSATETESRAIKDGFTATMDTVNIELTDGKVYETILEMNARYSDAVAGDTVTMVELQYDMGNTEDIARTLFLDQAEIVTNTGRQVDSELRMSEGLEVEMLGAVKSSGNVKYVLPDTAVKDIEWIDVFITYPYGEGIDITANEPQKFRVNFE